MIRFRLAVLTIGMALLLSGCGLFHAGGAQEFAEKVAAGLEKSDLSGLGLTNQDIDEYQLVTAEMDDIHPEVSVAKVDYPSSSSAQATLNQSYKFENKTWSFTTIAQLTYNKDAKTWSLDWQPNLVHPELTNTSRLVHTRTPAKRAPIIDRNGEAIVEERPVYRVGIDKTKIASDQWQDDARKLAKIVGIDPEIYNANVQAAGPQAFVEAIIYRAGQVPQEVSDVAGALALEDTLPLTPTPTFSSGILGTVGQATAEEVEKSNGAIKAGDIVGKSGLQLVQDERLRGTPGHIISLTARDNAEKNTSSMDAGEQNEPSLPLNLFSVAPVNAKPLKLTMDLAQQTKLENALANVDTTIATVVLDESGGIISAGVSPGGNGKPLATTGRYAPGSTMKVVSALALVRRGMSADSLVNCSRTATVNGREFTNYGGYPESKIGEITLTEALGESCNTAFINAEITSQELSEAAASLGIGIEYDSGFEAFYGEIPPTDDPVLAAANSFGQGHVSMNAMTMATESASVNAGHTVIAHLIADQVPEPKGKPLTAAEAAEVKKGMQGVLDGTTGWQYQGALDGMKTGTAEFSVDGTMHYRRWVTGFKGNRAIAIMNPDSNANQPFLEIIRTVMEDS